MHIYTVCVCIYISVCGIKVYVRMYVYILKEREKLKALCLRNTWNEKLVRTLIQMMIMVRRYRTQMNKYVMDVCVYMYTNIWIYVYSIYQYIYICMCVLKIGDYKSTAELIKKHSIHELDNLAMFYVNHSEVCFYSLGTHTGNS